MVWKLLVVLALFVGGCAAHRREPLVQLRVAHSETGYEWIRLEDGRYLVLTTSDMHVDFRAVEKLCGPCAKDRRGVVWTLTPLQSEKVK